MTGPVRDYFDREAKVFDSIYEGKGPFGRWIDDNFRRDIRERWRLTIEACGDLNGKTALDIGCGGGRYAVDFAKRGARQVIGLDFAPKMIGLARDYARTEGLENRCEFITGDFLSWESAQRFDICVAMGVFDYIAEPRPFLERMVQLTDHRIIASFPSNSFLRGPLRKFRYRLKGCPVYLFDRPQIQEILKGLGDAWISKIRGHGMDYFVHLDVGSKK